MKQLNLTDGQRNFGLDALRSVSIWLVLLQHLGFNIPGLGPLKIGSIGVEIFFVLSGFLIGGILIREIEKGRSVPQTLWSFWFRRWMRILPLYYAVLLFKFIVIDHSIGIKLLYYLFFLQNNFYGVDFMPVSWSLVIEEWFYLITPFVLLFIFRQINGSPKQFLALVFFVIGINLLRLAYVLYKDVPYQGLNGNFPFRLDSLFTGVMLAYVHRFFPSVFEKLRKPVFFISGMLIASGYVFYYWLNCTPVNSIDTLLIPRTAGFFILPAAFALTVPWISRLRLAPGKTLLLRMIASCITWTSLLTYAIYLLHPLIFNALHRLKNNPGLFTITAIILTYVAAFIVYQFFEKPILKLRDRKKSKI